MVIGLLGAVALLCGVGWFQCARTGRNLARHYHAMVVGLARGGADAPADDDGEAS